MANLAYNNIEISIIRRPACEDDVKKIVKFVNTISKESGNAVFAVDENNVHSQIMTGAVVVERNRKIIAYIGSEFIGYSESMNPVVELRSACVLKEYRKNDKKYAKYNCNKNKCSGILKQEFKCCLCFCMRLAYNRAALFFANIN